MTPHAPRAHAKGLLLTPQFWEDQGMYIGSGVKKEVRLEVKMWLGVKAE